MALSQDIIYFRLSQKHPARFSIRTELKSLCKQPALYEKGADLSGCAIVIDKLDMDRIDVRAKSFDNSLFVCLGTPDNLQAGQENSLIVLEGEVTFAGIINELQGIFAEFNEWNDKLKTSVLNGENFQDLSDYSEHLFDDAFCIQDNEFHFISYSSLSEERGLIAGYVNATNSSPVSVVNEFMASPQFTLAETNRETLFFSFSFGDAVIKNLFSDDQRIGIISIHVNKIDDRLFWYYTALLDTLAFYVELLYEMHKGFNRDISPKDILRVCLIDYLNRKTVSPNYLERALDENKWDADDEYRLVQVKPNPRHDGCLNSKNIILAIMHDWKGCIAFEYYGKLLMLENVSRFSIQNNSDFLQVLEAFLEEYLLIASVGRTFRTLQCISTAYEQTETGFSIGMKLAPEQLCYHFDEFALDYMLEHCLGSYAPKDICSDKLLKLRKYDKEKNSEMCKSLSTYIECHYNASAAADKLCIHRTSFLNRLDRIREISGLDLDSGDELFYYTLSQKLLG